MNTNYNYDHISVDTLKVSAKMGASKIEAIKEAFDLAMKLNIDVSLNFNDTIYLISHPEIQGYHFK